MTNPNNVSITLQTPIAENLVNCTVAWSGPLARGGTLDPAESSTLVPQVTPSDATWSFSASIVFNVAASATPYASPVVNLRAFFNDRNSGSTTQPGAEDRAGGVSSYTLADSADTWSPVMTTSSSTRGTTVALEWLDDIDAILPDAATDWTVAVEVQVRKAGGTDTTNNWFGGGVMGIPSGSHQSLGAVRGYDSGANRAGADEVWDTDYGGSPPNATTGIVRGLIVPWPGSGTNAVGHVLTFGQTAAGAPQISSSGAHSVGYDTTGSVPKLGVMFGSLSGTFTDGAGAELEILARGIDTPRSKDDGGAGWSNLAFPGGAPDTDPDSVYVSDGGASATRFLVTLDGSTGNSAQGHTPSTGADRPKWDLTPPAGIDLYKPLEIEIVQGPSWDDGSTGSLFVGVALLDENDEGTAVVFNDEGATQRPYAMRTDRYWQGAQVSGADRARGVIILAIGASGADNHGVGSVLLGTQTGPIAAENVMGGAQAFAVTGSLRLVFFAHGFGTYAGNVVVDAKIRIRNLDVDYRTTLAVA